MEAASLDDRILALLEHRLDENGTFVGDERDPWDPFALDPASIEQWPRPAMSEIERTHCARSSFFGTELREVGAYVADLVQLAEEAAAGDARARGLSQAEAEAWRIKSVKFARRSAWSQVALKLDLTPGEAERLVVLAESFLERCPETLHALEAGLISKAKALILLEQTEQLSPELRRGVEAAALAQAAGRTAGRFRELVRRCVRRADRDAVRRREAKARADRRVELRNLGDGMFALHAVLPSEEALAAFGILDTVAQAAKKAQTSDDLRGIDALRADALLDLLRNPGGQDRISYQVRVVVPLGTVLGIGDEDGHIPGHGPIPAEVCRRIAGDNQWKRLLEDPDTGHLLDVGADTYAPSVRLTDFVHTRDQTCRWPGCRRQAHTTEIDHTVEFRIGGRTIRINLSCLCKLHHQLKHLPGWKLVQDPDGTLTFTTPTGEIYRTRPPTLLGEDRATGHVAEEESG
ncbi:MAG: DUF222 domain-containing protein [Sporichthyaceae bacterium]